MAFARTPPPLTSGERPTSPNTMPVTENLLSEPITVSYPTGRLSVLTVRKNEIEKLLHDIPTNLVKIKSLFDDYRDRAYNLEHLLFQR